MSHLLAALWDNSSYKGIMFIPHSSHFFLRSAWRYRLGVAVGPQEICTTLEFGIGDFFIMVPARVGSRRIYRLFLGSMVDDIHDFSP